MLVVMLVVMLMMMLMHVMMIIIHRFAMFAAPLSSAYPIMVSFRTRCHRKIHLSSS